MHTERDAKELWCPFTRYAWPAGSSANRDPNNHPLIIEATRCIASQCTAWRWLSMDDQVNSGKEPRGFCGLSGEPTP